MLERSGQHRLPDIRTRPVLRAAAHISNGCSIEKMNTAVVRCGGIRPKAAGGGVSGDSPIREAPAEQLLIHQTKKAR